MSKTPKEMAEEWASGRWYADNDPIVSGESKVGFLAGYQAAKDQLADTSKVMPQWISVKERLPQINKGFIGFVENKEVCNCYRYPNRSSDDSPVFYAQCKLGLLIGDLEIISHWMPLPEAPREQE